MTKEELIQQYEDRAAAEREAGTTIEFSPVWGYLAIDRSDGTGYFFQGEDFFEMLDEVPNYINPEDYFLAISQNW